MDLKELTNRVKELVGGKRGGSGAAKPNGGDMSGAQPGAGAAPGEAYPSGGATPQTGADQAGVTGTQSGAPEDDQTGVSGMQPGTPEDDQAGVSGTQSGTPEDGLDANGPDAADRDVGGPGAEPTP